MMSERSLLSLRPVLIFAVPVAIFGIILLSRGGGNSTVLSAWLSPDVPAQINLPLGTASQIYGFRANPGAPTHLLLNSSGPGLSFTAEVRSDSGQRVAMLGGGLQDAMLTVGPGDSLYEVEFKGDGGVLGAVSLMVSDSPVAASRVSPPADGCSLSSAIDADVNVRSGPSFDYAVITVLPRGTFLTPDARTDSGWYRVSVNQQAGWVLASMVNVYGPCQNLALISLAVTPAPVLNVVTTPCVVNASTNVNIRSGPGTDHTVIGTLLAGSSLTVSGRSDTGWYTVTAGSQQGWVSGSVVTLSGACSLLPLALPLPSPTPLPVAPFDTATFSLVTDRDGSSQLSEVISYPNGDQIDLIQMSVANLYFEPPDNYREFTLTLTCAGPGAEYVRWGAPEDPIHRCGSTIRLPFLYDFSQQYLSVTLDQPGYVTYTLAASR